MQTRTRSAGCAAFGTSVWTGSSSGTVEHLERVLTTYIDHYNRARPHRGIGLEAPVAPDKLPQPVGSIERVDVLGGLVHEYRRAA